MLRLVCRSPLQRSLQEIEKLAKEQAGCEFSLSSAQEVAHVLFNVLRLPVPPNAKPLRGGKLFSTSAEVSLHLSLSSVVGASCLAQAPRSVVISPRHHSCLLLPEQATTPLMQVLHSCSDASRSVGSASTCVC